MNFEHATPELFAAMAKAGRMFLTSDKYPNHIVSDDGRVFSLKSKRFLRGMMCGKYQAVQVATREGTTVRRYVHRLVAELAYGYVPEGLEVCHNDGNRMNNAPDNLRWDTRSSNMADKNEHGTDTSGARNPMAKLTGAAAKEIRRRVASGEVQRSLCAEYGVSPMTISRVVRNETWRKA